MAPLSKQIELSKSDPNLIGSVKLDGSKSISNRVLIIRALSNDQFEFENLSTSDDTHHLKKALANIDGPIDIGHAGTSMRFSTAYYALKEKTQIITGSDRMKQRPIGILVDALREIGGDIEYLEKEGYPPLQINPFKGQITNEIHINGNISSQFISALLLIAPSLPQGLTIHIKNELVSRPYVEMTTELMKFFGAEITWKNHSIQVSPGTYSSQDFRVEADWSAASYYYVLAAFAKELDLKLYGLSEESLQADQAITGIARRFGVETSYGENFIHLKKKDDLIPEFFEYDFIKCPDIAQSVFTLCAGWGTKGLFSGLQTLAIKETDRTKAMANELSKTQVYLSQLPDRFSKKGVNYFMQEGQCTFKDVPVFDSYQDHRMAMSLACLGILNSVRINDPSVVNKSYPTFWKDLESLGFTIQGE